MPQILNAELTSLLEMSSLAQAEFSDQSGAVGVMATLRERNTIDNDKNAILEPYF